MKAFVLYGKGDAHMTTDFPEPSLEPNSVKIAVSYCGLCGTDLHKYEGKGGSRPVVYPVPLGHEASGILVEVGENVRDFRPGDRVAVNPNWYCKKCYFCKNGQNHLCTNSKGVVKGFAEYICPPAENVHKIPDTLSLKHAALAEPLSCCIHGMDLLDMKMGQTVAIIGLGSIGSIFLQLCRIAGAANIIVIEPQESKRKLAEALGATLFLNPSEVDVLEEIHSAGIPNVDRVIECVGFPATMESALEIAGRGAVVVLFGLSPSGSSFPFRQYDAFQKELVIKTSYINPDCTERAIALLDSDLFSPEPLISKVLTMEEMEGELVTRNYFKKGKVLMAVSGQENGTPI